MDNNSILQLFMLMMRGGGNPQSIATTMLRNNPQVRQMMSMYEQKANGMSPKDFVFKIAEKNGIKTETVVEFARQFGIK